MGYTWKSDFQTAWIYFGNNTYSQSDELMVTDNGKCGGFEEDFEINATECENSDSPFYEELPGSKQFFWELINGGPINEKCEPIYLNDGFCDEACRTDECLQDGNDCDLITSCVDDYCNEMFLIWAQLAGPTVYNANYSVVCNDWIDIIFGFDEGEFVGGLTVHNAEDCKLLIPFLDYNDDKHVNFKEFVGLLVLMMTYDDMSKALGVNCSACVGVDHYNEYIE